MSGCLCLRGKEGDSEGKRCARPVSEGKRVWYTTADMGDNKTVHVSLSSPCVPCLRAEVSVSLSGKTAS